MYVLDEPSIGLHARDNDRLLHSLEQLRNLGNTVLVVEHDEDTIRRADYVVDLGPGAGNAGGYLVAKGKPEEIAASAESLTGQYLSGRARFPVPAKRRSPNGKSIQILGAHANNLKEVDVSIPLGLFTVVTGVSGSGKSTLVNDILYRALAQKHLQIAGAARNAPHDPGHRAHRQNDRDRSSADWTYASFESRPPTPAFLRRFANYSRCCRNPANAATGRAASAST